MEVEFDKHETVTIDLPDSIVVCGTKVNGEYYTDEDTEEYVKESCDGIKNEIDSPIFMENVISLVSDWREQNKL